MNLLGTYDSSELEEIELNVHVFPNPSNGAYTISASKEVDAYSVIDLSGRIVMNDVDVLSKHFTVDLSQEETGMYVLQMMLEDGVYITRLMKK